MTALYYRPSFVSSASWWGVRRLSINLIVDYKTLQILILILILLVVESLEICPNLTPCCCCAADWDILETKERQGETKRGQREAKERQWQRDRNRLRPRRRMIIERSNSSKLKIHFRKEHYHSTSIFKCVWNWKSYKINWRR